MISSLIPFGFLPVIAYLITGSLSGKRQALWSALAVGAAETGFAIAGMGRVDWPGLAGFALLAALIAAAFRSGDDFYFKIHGALSCMASALVLMIAWHGFDKALLLDLSASQVGLEKLAAMDPRLTEETVAEMLRLLSFQLPWWLILHALLTIYAAANWGKWIWALVRVPGFVIMLLLASAFTQGAVIEEISRRPAPAAPSGMRPGKASGEPALSPAPGPAEPAGPASPQGTVQ